MSEVRKTVNSLYGYPVEDTEARQKATENAEAIVELSEEIEALKGDGETAVKKLIITLEGYAEDEVTEIYSTNMTYAETVAAIESGEHLFAELVVRIYTPAMGDMPLFYNAITQPVQLIHEFNQFRLIFYSADTIEQTINYEERYFGDWGVSKNRNGDEEV